MTEDHALYNTIAALRNVAAFTTLVERVQNRAYGLPGMACHHGWSGFGKSTAAVYAANQFDAVLVQMQSKWTAKKLCRAILKELGEDDRGNTADLIEQISAHLARRGSPLIIDEADHGIDSGMAEVFRDFYEGSQMPVILIGEELLPQKIRRWERLHGRMLHWAQAVPSDYSDLERLEKIYGRGIEFAPELKKAILAKSKFSARRISVNQSRIAEDCLVRGAARADLEILERVSLYTGEAPTARRSEMDRSL